MAGAARAGRVARLAAPQGGRGGRGDRCRPGRVRAGLPSTPSASVAQAECGSRPASGSPRRRARCVARSRRGRRARRLRRRPAGADELAESPALETLPVDGGRERASSWSRRAATTSCAPLADPPALGARRGSRLIAVRPPRARSRPHGFGVAARAMRGPCAHRGRRRDGRYRHAAAHARPSPRWREPARVRATVTRPRRRGCSEPARRLRGTSAASIPAQAATRRPLRAAVQDVPRDPAGYALFAGKSGLGRSAASRQRRRCASSWPTTPAARAGLCGLLL